MSLLSPSSQAVQILIGEPASDGYTLSEIAASLGQPASWVSERLASLREELLLTTGLFFPLTDSEYEALRESITRHGIRTPVVVGEHIALVDGRHRLLIAEELGLLSAPAIFLQGLEPEQERELAIGLNAARRQMTRQQKRVLVGAELHRDPARSDRWIASICGVSHPFVASVRQELAVQEAAESPVYRLESATEDEPRVVLSMQAQSSTSTAPPLTVLPPARTDRAGASRTSARSAPTALAERRPITPACLGYAACSHGEVHTIYRDPDGTSRLASEPD